MAALDGQSVPDGSDNPEASRSGRRLEYLGTTASTAISDGEFAADLEHVFRRGVAEELSRLVRRWKRAKRAARAAERVGDWPGMIQWDKSARWAECRARTLGLPRFELVDACSMRWRTVRCGCGIMELRVGCDQTQLCNRCRRAHWKRWRKRITRALGAHYRAELAVWRGEVAECMRRGERRPLGPRIYMLTLTAKHTGDLRRDRDAFGRAWRKLYNRANERGWWSHYAAAYEVGEQAHLPVEQRDGHLHLHVAVIARWIPYDELRAAWLRAMPGALVLDVSVDTPKTMRKRKRTNAVAAAAEYLASYVTKGVDVDAMSGAKAGELLVAFRNRRKVTCSAHFWKAFVPRCECPVCGQKHRMVSLPPGIVSVAPGAVLKSQAEQLGVWLARGAVQRALALERAEAGA